MAQRRKIMQLASKWRGLVIGVLAFYLLVMLQTNVLALPVSPIIGTSDWRTGGFEVTYSNVEIGNLIRVYARRYNDSTFTQVKSFTTTTTEGSNIVEYFENGQSVWYYITQENGIGEESMPSLTAKVTPPITAFIINWDDMWAEMMNYFDSTNVIIENAIINSTTPSDQAMEELKDAINDLKESLGVSTAEQAGADLQAGIGTMQDGLSTPAIIDDGNGTYTGGTTGGNTPFPDTMSGGLEYPDSCKGTDTDISFTIPYMVDMEGELVCIKLFTEEQLEKMKWLGLIRTLASATLFILFAFWLVTRFTPQLKS